MKKILLLATFIFFACNEFYLALSSNGGQPGIETGDSLNDSTARQDSSSQDSVPPDSIQNDSLLPGVATSLDSNSSVQNLSK
ncbi:MAG TPA: hypothetical protein VLM37_04180 [Fibrobacteraceae bacterium]|nr:hypothetical protein [Fibrobacteraceae bacterium]